METSAIEVTSGERARTDGVAETPDERLQKLLQFPVPGRIERPPPYRLSYKGRIDFACNNADLGESVPYDLADVEELFFDRMVVTSLKGTLVIWFCADLSVFITGTGVLIDGGVGLGGALLGDVRVNRTR